MRTQSFNKKPSTPAPIAALPIIGGSSSASSPTLGDAIQKLFVANTVEELIVYKSSLQAQAAAVDDDVRVAIGQRYRDLLATCEEVVGMEAVCQSVDRARQRRQQQLALNNQMAMGVGGGAGGSGGGSSRFANALRRAHMAQSGTNTPSGGASQQPLPTVATLLGLATNTATTTTTTSAPRSLVDSADINQQQQQHEQQHAQVVQQLSIIHQSLTARLGGLQVLLQRCGAPTALLQYAQKVDAKLSSTAAATATAAGTAAANLTSNRTAGSGSPLPLSVASPSNNATTLRNNGNPFAVEMDSLMSLVPPPPATTTGTSLLFHHTALEHSRLLSLCQAFTQLLRKISSSSSSSSSPSSSSAITVSTGGAAVLASDADPTAVFAATLAQTVQKQMLSTLMPRKTSLPQQQHIPNATTTAPRDVRTQLEGLVVKALSEAYRKGLGSGGGSSSPSSSNNATTTSPSPSSPSPGRTTTTSSTCAVATHNSLLMFYSDLHQALTVEEVLAEALYGVATSSASDSSSSSPAMRALMRLIDLQEVSMRGELSNVVKSNTNSNDSSKPSSASSSASSKLKAVAVLSSARLCINGVNGLLAYMCAVLNALRTVSSSSSNKAASPTNASNAVMTTTPHLQRYGAATATMSTALADLSLAASPIQDTASFLLGLASQNNNTTNTSNNNNTNNSSANTHAHTNNKKVVPERVSSAAAGAEGAVAPASSSSEDAFLDTLLVHVCGGADFTSTSTMAEVLINSRGASMAAAAAGGNKTRVPASVNAPSTTSSSSSTASLLHQLAFAIAAPQPIIGARCNMASTLLCSLGEDPSTFLEWRQPTAAAGGASSHPNHQLGGDLLSCYNGLVGYPMMASSTPSRGIGVGGGAWALSPSPRPHGNDLSTASNSAADVVAGNNTQSVASPFSPQPWDVAIARALLPSKVDGGGVGDEDGALARSSIEKRIASLQQVLAAIMFGVSEGGEEPSATPSLLALLQTSPSSSSSSSSSGSSASSPSATIASAKALQSLEVLLSSVGGGGGGVASSASSSPPSANGWNHATWKACVASHLSAYVVDAVRAVICSIASLSVQMSSLNRSVGSNNKPSLPLSLSLPPATTAASNHGASPTFGLLASSSSPTTATSAAAGASSASAATASASSSAAASADVEARILSLVMGSRSSRGNKKTGNPTPSSNPPSSPSSSPTAEEEEALLLFQLFEALGTALDRGGDASSSSSAILKRSVRHSLESDLLAVVEKSVADAAASSSSSPSASPLPPVTPIIAVLIACMDTLLARATEEEQAMAAAASAAAAANANASSPNGRGNNISSAARQRGANVAASPVTAAVSGVFMGGTMAMPMGSSGEDSNVLSRPLRSTPSSASMRFLIDVLRPKFTLLFEKCFALHWGPAFAASFEAMLVGGWEEQLLSRSSVRISHDFERLNRITAAALKYGPRARRLQRKMAKKQQQQHGSDSGNPSPPSTTMTPAQKRLTDRSERLEKLLQSIATTYGIPAVLPSSPLPTSSSSSPLNHTARNHFANSVKPLLWGTETVSGAAVSFPKRTVPAMIAAVWWAHQTISHDISMVFNTTKDDTAAAAAAEGSVGGVAPSSSPSAAANIADFASARRLSALASTLLTPLLFSLMHTSVTAAAGRVLSEGTAARERADKTLTAALKNVLGPYFAALAKQQQDEASAAVPMKGSVNPTTASAPTAAVAVAPAKKAEPKPESNDNGWGEDDDDFELDYSDDDEETKKKEAAAEEASKEVNAAAAPSAAAVNGGDADAADSVDENEDDDDDFDDEDVFFYNEFAAQDITNSGTSPTAAAAAPTTTAVLPPSAAIASSHGICDEFFLQLAFDLSYLEKALSPPPPSTSTPSSSSSSSSSSPTPQQWAQQCASLIAAMQQQADAVGWSLAFPLIRQHSEGYFTGGRLVFGFGLSAINISSNSAGKSGGPSASASPIPFPSSVSSPAAPTMGSALLYLPNAEIGRLPLLPVALPQATLTSFAMPPPPSSSIGTSSSSSVAGRSGGGVNGASAAAGGGGRSGGGEGDAATRLVSGATASLKSFLGGW